MIDGDRLTVLKISNAAASPEQLDLEAKAAQPESSVAMTMYVRAEKSFSRAQPWGEGALASGAAVVEATNGVVSR